MCHSQCSASPRAQAECSVAVTGSLLPEYAFVRSLVVSGRSVGGVVCNVWWVWDVSDMWYVECVVCVVVWWVCVWGVGCDVWCVWDMLVGCGMWGCGVWWWVCGLWCVDVWCEYGVVRWVCGVVRCVGVWCVVCESRGGVWGCGGMMWVCV